MLNGFKQFTFNRHLLDNRISHNWDLKLKLKALRFLKEIL